MAAQRAELQKKPESHPINKPVKEILKNKHKAQSQPTKGGSRSGVKMKEEEEVNVGLFLKGSMSC